MRRSRSWSEISCMTNTFKQNELVREGHNLRNLQDAFVKLDEVLFERIEARQLRA